MPARLLQGGLLPAAAGINTAPPPPKRQEVLPGRNATGASCCRILLRHMSTAEACLAEQSC